MPIEFSYINEVYPDFHKEKESAILEATLGPMIECLENGKKLRIIGNELKVDHRRNQWFYRMITEDNRWKILDKLYELYKKYELNQLLVCMQLLKKNAYRNDKDWAAASSKFYNKKINWPLSQEPIESNTKPIKLSAKEIMQSIKSQNKSDISTLKEGLRNGKKLRIKNGLLEIDTRPMQSIARKFTKDNRIDILDKIFETIVDPNKQREILTLLSDNAYKKDKKWIEMANEVYNFLNKKDDLHINDGKYKSINNIWNDRKIGIKDDRVIVQ